VANDNSLKRRGVVHGFTIEDDGSGHWEIWDMQREEIPARFDQNYFQQSEVERILRRLSKRCLKGRSHGRA
jgi:hypothetical protein